MEGIHNYLQFDAVAFIEFLNVFATDKWHHLQSDDSKNPPFNAVNNFVNSLYSEAN